MFQLRRWSKHAPYDLVINPGLQETLAWMLGVFEGLDYGGKLVSTSHDFQTTAGAHTPDQQPFLVYKDPLVKITSRYDGIPLPRVETMGGVRVTMSDEEQFRSDRFRNMDSPQFQGGHTESAYNFDISFHERLYSMRLVEFHRVDQKVMSRDLIPYLIHQHGILKV